MENFYVGMPNFLSSETRKEFAKCQSKRQISAEKKQALKRWARLNAHEIMKAGWRFDRSAKAKFLLEKARRDHYIDENFSPEKSPICASLRRSKHGEWTELFLAAYVVTSKSQKMLLVANAKMRDDGAVAAEYWRLYRIGFASYELSVFRGSSQIPTLAEARKWTEHRSKYAPAELSSAE